MKILYFSLSLLLVFANNDAVAQYRGEPECLNEQLTKDALIAALNDPNFEVSAGQPPGELIMSGPFADPLYSAPGWTKREWRQIFRAARPVIPGATQYVQRYSVVMHFMYNVKTREYAQVKYKSDASKGCIGETVIAEYPRDMGSTQDPSNPMVFGPSMIMDGTSFFFSPLNPNVIAIFAPANETMDGFLGACNPANNFCALLSPLGRKPQEE